MTPLSKKRRLETDKGISKPRKRQKVKQAQPKTATVTSVTSSGRPVALEELDWREVPLPDQLDDAEGFFGLEEVDGVDVVHNPQSGQVEYISTGTRKKRKERGDLGDVGGAERSVHDNVDVRSREDEEEWKGFEDENVGPGSLETSRHDAAKAKTITRKKINGDVSKKKADNSLDRSLAHPTTEGENAFAGLENEVLETEVDVSAWNGLDLSPETMLSLARLGFSRPTPIQFAVIPEIRAGHDVIGKASTGSGKTLAFGIPILEYYLELEETESSRSRSTSEVERHDPYALILSPTRELAHQLTKHLTALFSNTPSGGPNIATVTGGLSLQKQRRLLANAGIVIGTPGRLWEAMTEGTGLIQWLKKTHFLVIDEADRLLSEGHFKEFEEILNFLDREDEETEAEDEHDDHARGHQQRQTLVFSATFHKGLQQKLAGKAKYVSGDLMDKEQSLGYLLERLNFREEKPKFIDVNPVSQMAEGLKEGLIECAALEKDLYLYSLLMYNLGKRTLIFTNSISSVRRLTTLLQELNLGAQALHSQMPQKARLRSIERFAAENNNSTHSILVATDVAARGLDIPHVQLVVHYHLPRTADMYVHRSGRTARATESGSSILLCAPEEVVGVRRLVAKVHATANNAAANPSKTKYYIRTLDLDRRVVGRLIPRVSLAKRITDSTLAKEKKNHEDSWLRTAAEELGAEYDSETFETAGAANGGLGGGRRGRGSGRQKAAREARSLTKGEVANLRAELKGLLEERVNIGVSERYLTAGQVDVDELLRYGDRLLFLGKLGGIGLDDD